MTDGERQVKDYLARPRRYENIDGLLEASGGLTLMGWAVICHVHLGLPSGSPWKWVTFAVFLAWPWALKSLAGILKRRFTYPRTGFAQPLKSRTRSIASFVLGLLFPVIVVLLWRAIGVYSPGAWFSFALGSLGMFCYVRLNRGRLTARWPFIAVLAAATFAIGAFAGSFDDVGIAHFAVIGSVWLISGALTFRQYVLHTRPAQESE